MDLQSTALPLGYATNQTNSILPENVTVLTINVGRLLIHKIIFAINEPNGVQDYEC